MGSLSYIQLMTNFVPTTHTIHRTAKGPFKENHNSHSEVVLWRLEMFVIVGGLCKNRLKRLSPSKKDYQLVTRSHFHLRTLNLTLRVPFHTIPSEKEPSKDDRRDENLVETVNSNNTDTSNLTPPPKRQGVRCPLPTVHGERNDDDRVKKGIPCSRTTEETFFKSRG